MERGWFDQPVAISVGVIGTVHKVSNARNAREAAEILINHWQHEGTTKHLRARRVCLEVLHGKQQAKVAQEEFVEAAWEAAILAELTTTTGDPTDGRASFEPPVKIRVGTGNTLRLVDTVQDACEVLIDWPHASPGPCYQSARDIVEGAIDGIAIPVEAREAFAALAEHAGILIE